jgi:hypothetical protein
MKIVKESHLDHNLSQDVVAFIKSKFSEKTAFFIETFELPEELGTVPCGLHGPLMGDEPVTDARLEKRGERPYESRVVDRSDRQVRQVTVIAGPHGEEPCILYTAFGGPLAPQEPGDPGCKDVEKSKAFWAEHALSA